MRVSSEAYWMFTLLPSMLMRKFFSSGLTGWMMATSNSAGGGGGRTGAVSFRWASPRCGR